MDKKTDELFEETLQSFFSAISKMGIRPLRAEHQPSADSRLVHDLGIAGDDFDELAELMSLQEFSQETLHVLEGCLPTEFSRDAFLVASVRTGLLAKLPIFREYLLGRITAKPMTVRELIETIQVSET